MQSLYRSYSQDVLSAYIIYLPSSPISVEQADRCLKSCRIAGQKAELFEGFDGTSGEVVAPKHLRDQSWIKWIKVMDHFQSSTEVACSLSHMALWVKCMEEDRPIVVLEHDAVVVRPYLVHPFFNVVSYLGCHEQVGAQSLPPTPVLSSINKNWNFINRAHAYCVDPQVAKKLFLNVLDRGIFESADVMMRCEDVAIVQTGLYAYDKSDGKSTQTVRKKSSDNRFTT